MSLALSETTKTGFLATRLKLLLSANIDLRHEYSMNFNPIFANHREKYAFDYVGGSKGRLTETVLLSTHNICFVRKIET